MEKEPKIFQEQPKEEGEPGREPELSLEEEKKEAEEQLELPQRMMGDEEKMAQEQLDRCPEKAKSKLWQKTAVFMAGTVLATSLFLSGKEAEARRIPRWLPPPPPIMIPMPRIEIRVPPIPGGRVHIPPPYYYHHEKGATERYFESQRAQAERDMVERIFEDTCQRIEQIYREREAEIRVGKAPGVTDAAGKERAYTELENWRKKSFDRAVWERDERLRQIEAKYGHWH